MYIHTYTFIYIQLYSWSADVFSVSLLCFVLTLALLCVVLLCTSDLSARVGHCPVASGLLVYWFMSDWVWTSPLPALLGTLLAPTLSNISCYWPARNRLTTCNA